MEIIVNKKPKKITAFNKACDYLSLTLMLLGIAALLANFSTPIRSLAFGGCFLAAAILFFTCAALGLNLRVFILDSWRELKKIAWPSRREAMQFTWIVFLFVTIMSLILWGLDSLIGWILYTFIMGR